MIDGLKLTGWFEENPGYKLKMFGVFRSIIFSSSSLFEKLLLFILTHD
jgi:hypothetical protein